MFALRQKCNGDITMSYAQAKDIYLGRIDKTKEITDYYCSFPCAKFVYVENIRAQCNFMVSEIAKVVDDWKVDYRLVMHLDPHHPELKKLLIRIRMLCDIKKFCQAVLDRKTEYELHELKLKALHTDGIALEEFHDGVGHMNTILKWRSFLESMCVKMLGS